MQHEVIEVSLSNGIKGLFVHAPDVPVMSFDFNFRAGDYYVEDPNKWEVAHLMEHLVPQANKQYKTGRERNIESEKNGAISNAYTDSYEIGYDAICADFEWERILDLELASITGPLFLEDEFQAEMGNVREELVMRGNNHFSTLVSNYWQSIGLHSLPNKERAKRLDNVKLEDVVAHYKRTHTTPNMRFVIGGNLPQERRKIIEKKLLNLDLPKEGNRTELPEIIVKNNLNQAMFVEQENAPDNVLMIFETFASRRINDPESDALGMVNSVLTSGLSSRIFAEARERGLLYNIDYSGHSQYKNITSYGIGIQCQAGNVDEVVKLIVREYKRIIDGTLDDSDIELARSAALGGFQMSNQTIGRTASWYCNRFFFEDKVDDFFKVPDDIRAVTRQAGIDAFKVCFAENNWGLAFFGPIDEQTRQRSHEKFATLFS